MRRSRRCSPPRANLPLIFGYKNSIDPAFRNFVSDLTYDLNVYINVLDQMDADCRERAARSRGRSSSRASSRAWGRNCTDYMATADRASWSAS